MYKIASFSEKLTAIKPAIAGATADPPCSTRFWIAFAVALTSGRETSYTVDNTFGDANGIKIAVKHIETVNKIMFASGIFNESHSITAPAMTPNALTIKR